LRAPARPLAILLVCGLTGTALAAEPPADDKPAREPAPGALFDRHTGDLDAILALGELRVLVPYSRTLFFYDRGREHGAVASALRELQQRLDEKLPGDPALRVLAISTTRDQLLPGLVRGNGAIAAGNITITEARLDQVEFTVPTLRNVSEIVVTGPGAPKLSALADLAGQEIHVRPVTSYHESLVRLNERFAKEGKAQMKLIPLPDELESEDELDMVHAGLIRIGVVDDWLATFWAPYLPELQLHPDLAVRAGGEIGWAVRRDSPRLRALLDEIITSGLKQGVDREILAQVSAYARGMQDATHGDELKKFDATVDFFRKYATRYGFDYLMLAAQGYQESRLDPSATGPGGAVGIMQVLPDTGMALGVGDITTPEANVHAGSKHLAQLMERYFAGVPFDEKNRTLFAFAAHEAGPRAIVEARDVAARAGLEPNVWFNNVEHVVARRVGQEPVQYVRNVFKYYVAYELVQEERARQPQ
jgi:membrane-bound lytic murein transglycosylase MltF